MQNKKYFFGVNFIFLRKKCVFFGRFYAFYGQRSVTAAWATRSPWSISDILLAQVYPLLYQMKKIKLNDKLC